MQGDAGYVTFMVTYVTLSEECVCCYVVQRSRVNDGYRDRQTYKAAMSSDLLPETRSQTYAIHIVSDSLLLGVIVHRPNIL